MFVHRGIEPSRDVAVGGFEPPRAGGLGIEIGGEPGAIGVERVDLLGQDRPAVVDFAPAIDRRLERVERLGQAPGRGVDDGLIGHGLVFRLATARRNQRGTRWKNVESATN